MVVKNTREFFRDYFTKDKIFDQKSVYKIFFKINNETVKPKIPVYLSKIEPQIHVYHHKHNPNGVLNIFGYEKKQNVRDTIFHGNLMNQNNPCMGGLNNAYLEGMYFGEKTTPKKYVYFIILNQEQKDKYEKNLFNNETIDLISPLAIYIIRMDNEYLHISTICRQKFRDEKKYMTSTHYFLSLKPDDINLKKDKAQDAETIQKFISNKQNIINIFEKMLVSKEKFTKKVYDRYVQEIYDILNLQDEDYKKKLYPIVAKFRRVHKTAIKKLDRHNIDNWDQIPSFRANAFFNYFLGIAEILGKNGISLDSVFYGYDRKESPTYYSYADFGFIEDNQRKMHGEFVGEYNNDDDIENELKPMVFKKILGKNVINYIKSDSTNKYIECNKEVDRASKIERRKCNIYYDWGQPLKVEVKPINRKRKREEMSNVDDIQIPDSKKLKKSDWQIAFENFKKEPMGLLGGGNKVIYLKINKKRKRKKTKEKKGKKGGKKKKKQEYSLVNEIISSISDIFL